MIQLQNIQGNWAPLGQVKETLHIMDFKVSNHLAKDVLFKIFTKGYYFSLINSKVFVFLPLSGNDKGLFAIDRSAGNITVNGTVDAERTDFFRITVRVSFHSVRCMIPADLSNSSNYGQGRYRHPILQRVFPAPTN